MVPGVYILLCPPGRQGTLLPTYSAAKSSKRLKALSVTILLQQDHCWIGKQHKQQKKCNCLRCLWSDQVALQNSYLFLISNNVWAIFSLGDHQINFATLNRFCPLSKPRLVVNNLLFLTDKTKLDGTPSKIKWKIHETPLPPIKINSPPMGTPPPVPLKNKVPPHLKNKPPHWNMKHPSMKWFLEKQ